MKYLKTFESHNESESLIQHCTRIDDLTNLIHLKVKDINSERVGYINDSNIKKDTLPSSIRISKSLTNDAGWIIKTTDLILI